MLQRAGVFDTRPYCAMGRYHGAGACAADPVDRHRLGNCGGGSVSFRRELLSRRIVATFKNNSPKSLEVAALFTSGATNLERRAELVIPAGGFQRMLGGNGWQFAAGQHIRLSNADYRPIEYVVPDL